MRRHVKTKQPNVANIVKYGATIRAKTDMKIAMG